MSTLAMVMPSLTTNAPGANATIFCPPYMRRMKTCTRCRLQTRMNLANGSALASIGLTIPLVVFAAFLFLTFVP